MESAVIAVARALALITFAMAKHAGMSGGSGRHPNPRFTGDGGGNEKSTCN
jgi:hypothetical protein